MPYSKPINCQNRAHFCQEVLTNSVIAVKTIDTFRNFLYATQFMSHPFGDLIRQHLNRKHGLSQNKLAAGIDQDPSVISNMCRGKRLSGKQARERVIDIIQWFHTKGVLTLVAEATILLEAAGMARLNAKVLLEARLLGLLIDENQEQVEFGQALFSRRDGALSRETDEIILLKLNDWKIVHSNVQELLLASLNQENKLRLLSYERTRSRAVDVEHAWLQHCESKATSLRRNLSGLSIRSSLINELTSMLQGEQYFLLCIVRVIEKGDRASLHHLQLSFYRLKETLIELLRVADHHISTIAEELIVRYNQNENTSGQRTGGEDD
jgi:hypothetical protein